MAACDIHVSLRSPTMGETSGTAIRALSLGKPLVVSDVGWFSELPDGVALKVGRRRRGRSPTSRRRCGSSPSGRTRAPRWAPPRASSQRPSTTSRGSLRARRPPSSASRAAAAVADAVLREVSEAAGGVGIAAGRPRPRRSLGGSPRSTSVGERLARVPAWAWLAGIVGLSWRSGSGSSVGWSAPFIFVDEVIYTELARSLADTGSFAVRGTAVSGYSLLYPALLRPCTASFDNLVDAYGAAKATNAIVMSLAAIPTYLLARRVAGERLALLGAVIAVASRRWPTPGRSRPRASSTRSRSASRSCSSATSNDPAGRGSRRSSPRSRSRSPRGRSRSPSCRRSRRRRSSWRCSGRAASALRPFVPLYVLGAAAAIGLVVLQAARGRSLDRPARRLQHRRRGRVRRRPGAAVLALARRGARPLRRDRALRGAPARAAGRPHPPRAAPGAPRGDDGVRRLVDARGRRVRVAVRVGPRPGPVPVLPRAAPRRRRARLGGARRSTTSRAARSPPRRSRWRWCWSSRTSGSSASPRSRTRSG